MGKKHTLKKVAALVLALGIAVGTAGCNFLVTDSIKDLKQVVATVNVANTLGKDDDYKNYKDDVEKLISEGVLSTDVPKRDLIAYFLNVGSSYVNNYGYTYEETFDMLMGSLTENKILTQYAVAYFLKKENKTADDCLNWVREQQAQYGGREGELLKAHPEVLTMQYFLTNGGKTTQEDMKEYWEAVYSLKKSLNNSFDSAETSYIKADEHTHTHKETRAMPSDVDVTIENYVPMKDGKLNYEVYTGRNIVSDCGEYEKQEGSTSTTRKKAYNTFLSNLQSYGLIQDGENVANITELNYYYTELANTLGQALINKYYEDVKDSAVQLLTKEYVTGKYNQLLEAQQEIYTQDYTSFNTAMDGVSDTSSILYGLQDFGFVYNILLPFSAEQEEAYKAVKNKGLTKSEVYNARKQILQGVVAKDLRGSWICEEEHDNYGYEKEDGKWYFFENNLTNPDKYERLTQYAGNYPYQGTIEVDENGKFVKTPNVTMKIDGFIAEMENYIGETSGLTASGEKWHTGASEAYGDADYNFVNAQDEVNDYGDFVYYVGKVDQIDQSPANYFNEESSSYQVLSAVNELMFAYSADTGCLNTYMGYAISPYSTDFVPEFEWAAQYVVRQGVGTYAVVPSDYGWHIIYCSYKFNEGAVFAEGYVDADKDKEGTFSNLFYESLKSSSATSHADAERSSVLNTYKQSVVLFTERYKDLLELDK